MKYPLTSQRLKQAMEQKGIIAKDLAALSGVSKYSISQYVNGSHAPSNLSSGKMAAVLGVDPAWLMGFDVDYSSKLTQQEETLLSLFRSMNREGKEKLLSYADDIAVLQKYIEQ